MNLGYRPGFPGIIAVFCARAGRGINDEWLYAEVLIVAHKTFLDRCPSLYYDVRSHYI